MRVLKLLSTFWAFLLGFYLAFHSLAMAGHGVPQWQAIATLGLGGAIMLASALVLGV